jgi:hypothetical protein
MDYGYLRAADILTGADDRQRDLTRHIIEARLALWATAGDPTDARGGLHELVAAKPVSSLPPALAAWSETAHTGREGRCSQRT